MKRFVTAVVFCSSLLVLCFWLVRPTESAGEDLVMQLLDLSAPPPLNPLVENTSTDRPESFYDPSKPPREDASIEDLIDYWNFQSSNNQSSWSYKPKPSDKVVDRLLSEVHRDPALLEKVLNFLPDSKHASGAIKAMYDSYGSEGSPVGVSKERMKEWLRTNSPYFTDNLLRNAQRLKDVDGYVDSSKQNDLLALTRQNFDAAKPEIDRMYRDGSQPVTQALATWALYKNALESDSQSDIERYRSELMRLVENKSLPDGTRDMAYDAIVRERDFPGRDDWSFSLYEDETLVNMPRYTMLTTLVMYAPAEKYVAKMIDLLESKSLIVRTAAARNLITALQREQDPEKIKPIVRALLPWLTDPKWINTNNDARQNLVRALQKIKILESVQPLIAALDEKQLVDADDPSAYRYGGYGSNAIANAANTMANAARYAANTSFNAAVNPNANVNRPPSAKVTVYPLRQEAIRALGNQGDQRAVPALRRIFPAVDDWGKQMVVEAINRCNGFTVAEQVDAIEEDARIRVDYAPDIEANSVSNSDYSARYMKLVAGAGSNRGAGGSIVAFDSDIFKLMLGKQLYGLQDPSDQLVNSVALRISELEKREPEIAAGMRIIVKGWKGRTVNAFLLLNLKNGKTDAGTVVKLLAERKDIRENQLSLVGEVSTGTPAAAGISACLINSEERYVELLEKGNNESRAAMLACARLIRASLPVLKVAEQLKSPDKRIALAAERYLESEDSPDAREIILGRYPGQAKIMGATTEFRVKGSHDSNLYEILDLFASVHPYFRRGTQLEGPTQTSFEDDEKRLQKEIAENPGLIAIYSYDNNFVRIFKNEVVFSWEDDPSRYRERKLEPEEFESLKELLVRHNAGELPPFLQCRDYCEAKQLTMVGKNGGRRVYVAAEPKPKFFADLESLFKDLRAKPSKLRYWLEKDIPGLEILFADDSLKAETVWKNADDLRILVSDKPAQELSESDLEQSMADAAESMSDEEEDVDETKVYERSAELIAKHRYDGVSWLGLLTDGTTVPAAQPNDLEYIVPADDKGMLPGIGRWRSTAGEVEMRSSPKGLFKLIRGRPAKVADDIHSMPIISANGRWVIASKYSETGIGLIRYDLQTGRSYPIKQKEVEDLMPFAFVPSVNRFLLGMPRYEHDYEDESLLRSPTFDTGNFYFVDPESGLVSKASGEMRPLGQQTFRPLQPTGKPNETWAAIPDNDKNETRIGVYDMRTFAFFKPVITVPKIQFGSMEMWVDGSVRKAYFVYNGHLLSIPLDPAPPKI